MSSLRLWGAWCLLAALPAVATAQGGREAVVMFKDGFHVRGVVAEKRDFIVDPASGQSFQIPAANGFVYIDDGARRIHFSPNQVAPDGIIPIKPGDVQN